ncbi:acyl-CoA dehydratase activase [Hydrogenoanaerobacterium sp.]|uniref:acyl-CoA dehydratase activase n=1 Tax=Hydrogenoanaerobacterium sp. TaxID=2953763 RepID=UPI002897806C|nr:acyl-CoA dehydratase activase [Hydrogenoanaerobacterium sp.]
MSLHVGIDIGSTTAKVVVMDDSKIIFKHYERHFSQVRQKTAEILKSAKSMIGGRSFTVAISGSAGFGVAKAANLEFIQEVFATGEAVRHSGEQIDIVIELGGEDAKILFLTGGLEERMNGTCAGGTGAFIDQMATLLDVTTDELDRLSLQAHRLYPIASRCGVFAKSDIQPLLNQGAAKADIAASIFQAVVDQTITGLAQGRKIEGRIAFLGGPLFFFKGLQKRFIETLHLTEENALFPDLGQFSVAIGSAVFSGKSTEQLTFDELLTRVEDSTNEIRSSRYLEPLFSDEDDYIAFTNRHAAATTPQVSIEDYHGNAYLGIDCGSTTTKVVLITEQAEILYSYYSSNRGNPVDIIKEQLMAIWQLCADRVFIRASVVTGYGEELIKSAFDIDAGIVETMAHFKAAKFFCPEVDFILDIGGQDIKCFQVKNDSVDSIMLNEACSSGCGSFIETFARSMGYEIEEFSKHGIFSQYPVDLGSRCTVFMNSSVKQAQKEGAGVDDISAGLSISVVKNAIYKVIRAHSADELGENIVVQGGTFYNDAVLRSFEKELGRQVIRPTIAGLMGAYGAALYGRDMNLNKSTTMKPDKLAVFAHTSKAAQCGLCTNRCNLTINTFTDGKKYISGNKCERPLGIKKSAELPNLYTYKLNRIKALQPVEGKRGKIGIPLGLNMFENIPFWHEFLTYLGFEVILSDISSIELYNKGRYSIPSDTACYPAKLMHGHIESLLEKGVDTIFYPCLTYNFDEGKGDNHYNCPVVAYYPELMRANITKLQEITFLYPYFGLHRRKDFEKKAYQYFSKHYAGITRSEIKNAAEKAYDNYYKWQSDLKIEGAKAIEYARRNKLQMVVLAGRPYHIDPEINHGIDSLISSFGIVVLSEDCVSDLVLPQRVNVLNQWTYHTRLYNAAKYCTLHSDTELVQLVSFGCGIDAITTDEVRDILERGGKLYTQLKIDEINNLGAVKIRIRSLLGAIDERRSKAKGGDVGV